MAQVQNKKAKISGVWSHFCKTADNKSVCCYCKKGFKSGGNTSNLWDHLKRCSSYKQTETCASAPSTASRPAQRKIETFVSNVSQYDTESRRKKDIDEAVVSMVIKDLQPFSIVNDEGFINLIKTMDPRYRLPCKTTLKNVLIENKYKALILKMCNEMSAVEYISVTCDLWTSKAMEAFLTVTCHFIDNELNLQTKVLSTKPLLSLTNHCSQNIAESLRGIFEEWKISQKNICVVTDNATSMIKACEILDKPHLSCVCHSINLAVQDCLKIENVAIILKKCKEIVKYFKSSTIAMAKLLAEQRSENPLKVIQEVPTRWNSCYAMISRIIKIKDPVNIALLNCSKNAPKALVSEEIEALIELEKILKVFDDITRQLSSSANVTSSLIIPLICGLNIELLNIGKQIETCQGKDFLASIYYAIQKRLDSYEGKTMLQIATILDPRFKKEGFRQRDNAWNASKKLEAEMLSLAKEAANDTDVEQTLDPQPSTAPNLFSFLKQRVNYKTSKAPEVAALTSKQRYLEVVNCHPASNPLLFWKEPNSRQFDPLALLAQKYLCIPASSVESERVFSKAGLIVSDRRTKLKASTVDKLLFLQKNLE